MKFQIPGYDDPFEIRTILMDANGTLCIGGKLIEGVIPRIRALRDKYKLVLCS